MKAVVYKGPNDVSVEEIPDAKIEHPADVLVRITSANICGSDLHMYEGRTSFEPGRSFGHENLGEVVEVGPAVSKVKVGERVVLPFNVACGFCKNCERGFTNYCLTMQPEPKLAGAAYGFADMGPYQGGQAEYLRVPYGDFNCLRLGEDAVEKELDYVMLADIFPTGWHATEMAGVYPGDSVVIYGGGPVGLMAAYSAVIKGAGKVMVVDRHKDRLKLAEQIGAIAVNDAEVDPVEFVKDQTMGFGADRGCECVGYQAHDPEGNEHLNQTLNRLVDSVRFVGGIGVVGVFLPQDPGSPDELEKQLLGWVLRGYAPGAVAHNKCGCDWSAVHFPSFHGTQEHLHAHQRQGREILAHGGQRRQEIVRTFNVVEADHTDVLRNPDPVFG
ncbi:glutathione-independent formaldehyde dehydrogenase [Paenarthrobacter nicotinovorans]|nr:glutathione-independent formaldehyde dehydrogenase [Paenarthrobacter nicotinovorans]